MAELQTSTLESVIRGHHIYKQIWWPLLGEILTLEREEDNNRDKFAVCLLKDATACRWPCSSRVFVGVLALPPAQRHVVVVYYLQFLFSCVAFLLPDEPTSQRSSHYLTRFFCSTRSAIM